MEPSQSKSKSLTPITPSFTNEYGSIDEYYDTIDNGLSSDYDPLQPLEPLIPLKYTSTYYDQQKYDHNTNNISNNSDSDALEIFFNTFIDQELDGDISLCIFTSSLTELSNELTETDIYKIFNYIDQDKSGYLDSVDFTQFCAESFQINHIEQSNPNIKLIQQLQYKLLYIIGNHPFMINMGLKLTRDKLS
eukprot:732247_1